jgi:hypothetical protein
VSTPLNRAKRPDVEAAAGVARHLDAFGGTLSTRERALLAAAVTRLLHPLDRMKERDPIELLDDDELRQLDELLAMADKPPVR